MATITRDALEWVQDEMESKEAQISDLEEELEASLEENAELCHRLSMYEAIIARMKATLQVE